MHVPVGVYENGAGQAGHGGAEGQSEHGGGVGGSAGWQRLVDHDDGTGTGGSWPSRSDEARQTNRELAAAVHVSTSTSSERVRALRAEGVIRGYHADVALEALGRHVHALIAVRIRPPSRENIEAFRDWAAKLPELIGVFVVSGAQDFLLHVGVKDTDSLYAFVIDRLTERAEVADVNTSVVYEHIRRTVLEPIDDDQRR